MGRVRLAARIIGFGAIGFHVSMSVGWLYKEVVAKGLAAITIVEWVPGGVLGGVVLAGCILSFWRERAAGIMLVSAAVVSGILNIVAGGDHQLMVWLIVVLPYLVAGILFLNSWRLSRQLA